MMKKSISKVLALLIFALGISRVNAQDRTVTFDVKDAGVSKPLTWGLDLAWFSESNLRRGIAFMEADRVDLVRVSFQPTQALVDGDLQQEVADRLNARLDLVDLTGPETRIVLNSNAPEIDPYFTDNEGLIQAAPWAELIDVVARRVQERGRIVVSAGPFNEPDYGYVGKATQQTFYEVAVELKNKARFDDIRINGGNTLNCDVAMGWYDFLKDRLDEGNTHQLAGSFDNYASFYQTVRANGHHATNDEVHNVMEAMVGAEYGMQTGIWWGTANYARGEFVKASDGVRLGYAEHRTNWTAASVYRAPDGKVQAFLGGSERQAATTTYKFVSENMDVFFDGHGPQREYTMTYPGGAVGSYQNGQTNAERVINITWGEDVQPVINGSYVLVNRNSGKVMEVDDGSTTAGANIQQGDYTEAAYQQWNVSPVDSRVGGDFSNFSITALHSDMTLDVYGHSLANGGNIVAWDNQLGENQQFYLEYAEDGWFYIRSAYNAKCLSVADSSTETGANIHQWEKINGASQQWRLLPVGAAVEFTAPNAPANLTGTSNTSPIHLAWDASTSSDVAGYTVFRAEQGGAYNTIARNVISTSYDDYSAVSGKQYYYKVNAVDHSLNRSVNSNEAGLLTAGGEGEVWLEAECGNVGLLWDTPSDGNASHNRYVTIQAGNNSTGSAPSSTSGHITYGFNTSEGTYSLWARVITPANTDDSFWIRIDDGPWSSWNDLGTNTGWTWLEIQNYSLTDGNHTLAIAYREDGAQLDKLYIGNSIPADEGIAASNCSDSEVWLEAECGNVGLLWDTPSDDNASHNQYVTIQAGNNSTGSAPSSTNGHITYDFNTSEGTYNLWARVITPANTDDSFWIRIDDGPWFLWNDLVANTSWTWLEVQGYSLTDGNHTLTIAYREDGAQLDKLYIGASTPSGEGPAAANCGDNMITLTIQENETGFCSVDGSIDSDHTGYTGTGFANTSNFSGAGVAWSVDIPSGGTYNLSWRYANGGTTDRTGQLMVDGSTVVSGASMPSTGSWTSWSSTSEVSLSLSAGTRVIRLEAVTSAGLSNIDYISITGIGPAGTSCDGPESARFIANEVSVSEGLSVYPNPVDGDMVTVSGFLMANVDVHVMVFDNAGRIISEGGPGLIEKGEFDMPVNVAGLKPGLYLIKIILGPDVEMKAFIKR